MSCPKQTYSGAGPLAEADSSPRRMLVIFGSSWVPTPEQQAQMDAMTDEEWSEWCGARGVMCIDGSTTVTDFGPYDVGVSSDLMPTPNLEEPTSVGYGIPAGRMDTVGKISPTTPMPGRLQIIPSDELTVRDLAHFDEAEIRRREIEERIRRLMSAIAPERSE